MKLEYLHEGSSDCPLIRIYKFQTKEIEKLHGMISDLAKGKKHSVVLDDLSFINPIEGCSLIFLVSKKDEGIALSKDLKFRCLLTSDSWMRVAELLTTFKGDLNGYQWLDETGVVSLLLSSNGKW